MGKKWTCLLVSLLLVSALIVGCGGRGSEEDNNNDAGGINNVDTGTPEPVDNDLDDNNDSNGVGEDDIFSIWTEEGSSALPEPWMAFPGSRVDIDWYARGLRPNSAWNLVAPPGTTREEVIDYYVEKADERDDFEVISTNHGITGIWKWKDYELMIETDYHYDYPEFIQFVFAFETFLE